MTRFDMKRRLTGGSEANSINKWYGGGFAALPSFDALLVAGAGGIECGGARVLWQCLAAPVVPSKNGPGVVQQPQPGAGLCHVEPPG